MKCHRCQREFTEVEIDAAKTALIEVEWFEFYTSRYGDFENIPLMCTACLNEIDPEQKFATLA